MLGLIESHTRVGVTNASATGNAIRAAYLACEEQFDDPARQGKPVMYNGVAVECGRFRLSGQPIFCFSEKSIEQLGWKKVPVKDDNMLGFREFCDQKTIPVSSPLGLEIKALYEACERQFNDPNRKGPVVCDDVEINCGAFKSFSRPVFCIAAAQLDHIKAKAAQRLGARAEGGSFAEDVTPRSIAPDALHIQSAGKAGMDRSSSQ